MSNNNIAETDGSASAGETINMGVDFTDKLDSGETVSTVEVAELTTTDLTITNEAANTAVEEIKGREVAIGLAAMFTVSGFSESVSTYYLKVTVTTSDSQTRITFVPIPVADAPTSA